MSKTQNNPILNSPYDEPRYHYATDENGNLNYEDIRKGRRIFTPDITVMPTKQDQKSFLEVNDFREQYETLLVNQFRKEIAQWRNEGYPHTTRVTNELLTFWFLNNERHSVQKLFFAQQEAIETAIWINEVANKSNHGQHLLKLIGEAQKLNGKKNSKLPRIAFKMATGSGKTVVMAALILYHFFNRMEYRSDTRYADNFLIIAPGITIKDRLSVLYVDTINIGIQKTTDYYHQRGLVPHKWEDKLKGLNARITITNYHAFEQRTLQGNKRSPFDGKINSDGERYIEKENYQLVLKRALSKLKPNTRLLVINDEAHHCYLPKEKGKVTEGENTKEENARASVWFNGLMEISKRFKVNTVYDLSATPYYLTGSGYLPYSLFPWVVSDFGLIEAIESGLVKIPFLPEKDNTQSLELPILRNLYEHVKNELPRKGQKRIKSDAKKEGEKIKEEPPVIPPIIKSALDQFYNHYKDTFEGKHKAEYRIEDTPPVFIVVCNNTSVSKEVYKYIAGYEVGNGEDSADVVTGRYELLSNYDYATKTPLRRPPTLLIDSDALENSDQINDDFKKVFKSEIENFKKEYRIKHPGKSVEYITEADILREVVNTVGKPNSLGSHIRCVVSVSMLTEGWDANTVTHIMGIRAFGSQLLCEQVAGRALRRQNYFLDKTGKFPPEYAHIIGVPFKMFKGGETSPPPPVDYKTIQALPERQKKYGITFPNIIGYRVESESDFVKADFSKLENFEIDCSKFPVEAEMENAFSPDKHKIKVKSVKEMRDQELIYFITKELISFYFKDDDGKPFVNKFNMIKNVVEEWYHSKVLLIGYSDQDFKRLLYFFNPREICNHIYRGICAERREREIIKPIFNHYNRFGSTKYVHGHTSKEVYPTKKSHVNYVVADTKSWEQIAAKTLEELDEVKSYVKNAFLGFTIPYISGDKDKPYYPDFIAVCKNKSGKKINLIIEITGMNQDKAEKKWFVENRWIPAVNGVKEKYGYNEWAFIEIANDIRDIKKQLIDKINNLLV